MVRSSGEVSSPRLPFGIFGFVNALVVTMNHDKELSNWVSKAAASTTVTKDHALVQEEVADHTGTACRSGVRRWVEVRCMESINRGTNYKQSVDQTAEHRLTNNVSDSTSQQTRRF